MSPSGKRPTPRFEIGDRVEIVDTRFVRHVDGQLVGSKWRYQGARGRVEKLDGAVEGVVDGRQHVILLDVIVETDPDFDKWAPREGTSTVLVAPIYLKHVDVVESIAELDEQGPA